MSRPSHSSLWAGLLTGQWLVHGVAIVCGVLVIRRLPPLEFGMYALAAATIGVLGTVVELGLNPILTREASRDPGSAGRWIARVRRFRLLAAISSGAVALAVAAVLPAVGPLAVLTILALTLPARAVWSGVSPIWVALGNRRRAVLTAAIAPLLVPLGLLSGVAIEPTAVAGALGAAGAAVAGGAITAWLAPKPGRAGISSTASTTPSVPTARLLAEGAPFLLASLATVLFLYLDLFIAARLVGSDQVAFYAVPLRILSWLFFIPGVWGGAFLPLYSRATRKGLDSLYRKDQLYLLGLGIVLFLVNWYVIAPLVPVFLGSAYAGAVVVTRLLGLSLLFACASAPRSLWLTARRGQAGIAIAALAGLAINALLAVLLGSRWGLPGIAWAKAGGGAAAFLLYGVMMRRLRRRARGDG